MKRLLIAAALAVAALGTPAFAADVGVSLSIGQPGFYGQLDIGGYPHPRVINSRPIIIERVRGGRPPIYLRVPDGHRRHWNRYCAEYGACGENVFFVHDNWYHREYAPRYLERHGGHHDHRDYRDVRHDRREHRRDYRREHRDHGRGHDRDR